MGYSGFTDNGSDFTGHFIDSNSSTLSVYRMQSGGKTIAARRLGFSSPLTFDDSDTAEMELLSAIHSQGEESLVSVKKTTTGVFEFTATSGSKVSFTLPGKSPELVFFHYEDTTNKVVTVSASMTDSKTHCMSVFTVASNSTTCRTAKSIYASPAYFLDALTTTLVAVGVDDVTRDRAGYSLHGVYVQAYKWDSSKFITDFSISIPFIHRIDDGLWVFQNNPLTGGFIVLAPTMGYPPTPVQHLVALRDGTSDFPKGTVFRMENEGMALYRKIQSVRFNPVVEESDSACHC